jgi:hydrogenase nickel incorporation protein HypA/HybF
MHELSIAYSIVEMVSEKAAEEKGEKVTRVELEIGDMAGIEIYALEFAWDVAVKESILEGSKLQIKKISAKARCEDCKYEYPVTSFYDSCPNCKSFRSDVFQGKELRVSSFYLD